jgi:hypothetical protein
MMMQLKKNSMKGTASWGLIFTFIGTIFLINIVTLIHIDKDEQHILSLKADELSHSSPTIKTKHRANSTSTVVKDVHWWKGQDSTADLKHPHLGAIHPDDGSVGWIVNPTVERLRPIQYHTGQDFVCPKSRDKSPAPFGIEGRGGNIVLKKIRKGLEKSMQHLSSNSNLSSANRPRILCMIYTVYRYDTGHENLAAIADTWGRRCDGLIGFSNVTEHSVGAISLSFQGEEMYENSKFCIIQDQHPRWCFTKLCNKTHPYYS